MTRRTSTPTAPVGTQQHTLLEHLARHRDHFTVATEPTTKGYTACRITSVTVPSDQLAVMFTPQGRISRVRRISRSPYGDGQRSNYLFGGRDPRKLSRTITELTAMAALADAAQAEPNYQPPAPENQP